MHMNAFVNICLIIITLADAMGHNSCFNDSSNLAGPDDEYAVVSFVVRSGRRFKRIEVAGIPSGNHLHSSWLQTEQQSWQIKSHNVEGNFLSYPIMALLTNRRNTSAVILVSLTPDFKSIQTCPVNYHNEEKSVKWEWMNKYGYTICVGPSMEILTKCTRYHFSNPKTSTCETTDVALDLFKRSRDKNIEVKKAFEWSRKRSANVQDCFAGIRSVGHKEYLVVSCRDVANMNISEGEIEVQNATESEIVLSETELEFYYVSILEMTVQISRIVVDFEEKGLDVYIAENRTTNIVWSSTGEGNTKLMEGPSNATKLLVAQYYNVRSMLRLDRIVSPWDSDFEYYPQLLPLEMGEKRIATKLVPICGKKKKLTNRKRMKRDWRRPDEQISDGSTINLFHTNEVFKERYQSANEERNKRLGLRQYKPNATSDLKIPKTHYLSSSDIITITRRPEQCTKNSETVQGK